jgi:hypothetical protein
MWRTPAPRKRARKCLPLWAIDSISVVKLTGNHRRGAARQRRIEI